MAKIERAAKERKNFNKRGEKKEAMARKRERALEEGRKRTHPQMRYNREEKKSFKARGRDKNLLII